MTRQPIPFQTTPQDLEFLPSLQVKIYVIGLSPSFIAAACELAKNDQGVFDLLTILAEETNAIARWETVADLEKSLDDYAGRITK